MKKLLTTLTVIGTLLMTSTANATDLENTLYLELKDGRVVIELLPEKAPNHVKRIKELAREKFYDGIVFHRVIEGFMAQTGDPDGNGTGGSGQKIKAEFNDVSHTRGVASMARSASPDSGDSQWFIVFDDATFLDKQYTAWGKVIEGMEYVDRIKKGDSARNGEVSDPDKMITLSVAADVEAKLAKPKKTANPAKAAAAAQ
ncbi:MAG: peptidylprolyl isomerase [Rickettsiales bacterium]|nr:peptidylprolyl isomerase [Rickettsiales bacterium]